MTALDEFINDVRNKLPDQCSTDDLVMMGIFNSAQSAANARKSKDSPGYFKLGRRIMYPKEGVIQWLNGKKYDCTKTDSNECCQTSASIPGADRVDNCGRKALSL